MKPYPASLYLFDHTSGQLQASSRVLADPVGLAAIRQAVQVEFRSWVSAVSTVLPSGIGLGEVPGVPEWIIALRMEDNAGDGSSGLVQALSVALPVLVSMCMAVVSVLVLWVFRYLDCRG